MYTHAFLDEFVPLYPLYAVLFADTGLSGAEISSLFVIWSVTSFALEVPSGVWADVFSRRRLVALSSLPTAAGFALWTVLPCYPSFAAGFVLWGTGTALASGALEALVHEELTHRGAAGDYARLMGRAQALRTTAVTLATALAAPVLAVGGYGALGAASVAVCLLTAAAGWALPESRGPRREHGAGSGKAGQGGEEDGEQGDGGSFRAVLRAGLAEVRREPVVRRRLLLAAVLTGTTALDEYVPLLAAATGVDGTAVPLLVLLVGAGTAVGGWCAGYGARRLAPVLAAGALCLAAGAAGGHPAGMAAVAAGFGVFQWAMVTADARLQESVRDRARATVTSIAGFGSEVVAVLVFAGYALGSARLAPGPLLALAAVPYLVVALALAAAPALAAERRRKRRPVRRRGGRGADRRAR
ncbi:MFS transporter [Streptomyces sp. TRM 70361]|uniref:MFS transporter n=1 Tax=Streptomyces sp. TRM 70361 TaxID=3116553 RepID=UPI002E7BE3F2|nr:MFS transporter [Streptomyces sp. TRM 70361]MEE1938906.1 MFS transporter [Streptomyces sp. TRM 70361]